MVSYVMNQYSPFLNVNVYSESATVCFSPDLSVNFSKGSYVIKTIEHERETITNKFYEGCICGFLSGFAVGVLLCFTAK